MKIKSLKLWARRQTPLCCALSALALLASVAQAQSIYGPGGLLLDPTADMPAKGVLSPAILWLPQRLSGGGHLTWTSYIADYGVSKNLEAGVVHLKISPGGTTFQDGSTGGYLKYRLVEAGPGLRPAVAVGANLLTGGDADARAAFVALSWKLAHPGSSHPVSLHLGEQYVDELDGFNRRQAVPYAGADITLTRCLTAFAEARAGFHDGPADDSDGTSPPDAIGVIWHPSENYKLVLAYAAGGWNGTSHALAVGIGYTFGGRR